MSKYILKNDKWWFFEIWIIETWMDVKFNLKFALKKLELWKVKQYISINYTKYNWSIPNPYSFKKYVIEQIKNNDYCLLVGTNIYNYLDKNLS